MRIPTMLALSIAAVRAPQGFASRSHAIRRKLALGKRPVGSGATRLRHAN